MNAQNPTQFEKGFGRVIRGGVYNLNTYYLRASVRRDRRPSRRYNNRGFRLVRNR
jgi:formylglycine-generating enzyme required for sulfatase activity